MSEQEQPQFAVGEEVIYTPPGSYAQPQRDVIDRITPTGQIGIARTFAGSGKKYIEYFSPCGWGRRSDGYRRAHIKKATPELLAEVDYRAALSKVRAFDRWDRMPRGMLFRIADDVQNFLNSLKQNI